MCFMNVPWIRLIWMDDYDLGSFGKRLRRAGVIRVEAFHSCSFANNLGRDMLLCMDDFHLGSFANNYGGLG